MSVFGELKRRNVVRVGLAYLAGAWLLIQVADVILSSFEAPTWIIQASIFALVLGFPVAVALAWFYELTPDGIKAASELGDVQGVGFTGRKLDFAIIGVLVLAVGFLLGRDMLEQTDSSQASIAVLPFENVSSDPEQDYFSDGIAEDVLNLLIQVPEFRVISRSSSFAFRGRDISMVAEELNVSHVLAGSVRKAGNTVRITAQLVDARADSLVWSSTFDRMLDDVFAIQDEIARSVLEQLRITLLGAAPKAKEVDPEAYGLVLQAKHILDGRTPLDQYPVAEEYLMRALEIEPGYARAMIELARLRNQEGARGIRPRAEAVQLMRDLAERALDADPSSSEGYAMRAFLAWRYDGDVPALARNLERALQLDPTNTRALGDLAYLQLLADPDEAIAFGEYARMVDPLCDGCFYGLGRLYARAGQIDKAMEMFERAQILEGVDGNTDDIGEALLLHGDAEAALAEFQKDDEPTGAASVALALYALGRTAEFDQTFGELLDASGLHEPTAGVARSIAAVYAYTGQTDAAFEWLEKMLAAPYSPARLSIAITALFDNLHTDPRWEPLLERIGIAPHQIAALDFHVTVPQ